MFIGPARIKIDFPPGDRPLARTHPQFCWCGRYALLHSDYSGDCVEHFQIKLTRVKFSDWLPRFASATR